MKRLALFGVGASLALTAGLTVACASSASRTRTSEPTPRAGSAALTAKNQPPRLVVLLVVDQARGDYFTRFDSLLRFGLRRLLDESVVFTDAHHHHSVTKTAPGHATLSSGVHPGRHGVISNAWIDPATGAEVDAVGDDRYEPAYSPQQLLVSSFGEWLRSAHPDARVYAASAKPRSAILLGGHHADAAFWYEEESGRFETSSYYLGRPPAWLEELNSERHADRYFGQAWEPLPEVLSIDPALGVVTVEDGRIERQFPHRIGQATSRPDADYYEALYSDTPYSDELLLDLAKNLVEAERLGADPVPDFLGLSFSALDQVGHAYGPDSPEVLDTLLRLDRILGELLEHLDAVVGLEHVVLALSADHGVPSLPSVLRQRGIDARRLDGDDVACLQRLEPGLSARFGEARWMRSDLFFDREVARRQGVSLQALESEARRQLESCPAVERVFTRAELLSGEAGKSPFGDFFTHSFHPERSPDLMIQLQPHLFGWTSSAVSHGTPYSYDTHVPLVFRLPGGDPRVVSERVYTVDLAPTLAGLLGLTQLPRLDGRDLSAKLGKTP